MANGLGNPLMRTRLHMRNERPFIMNNKRRYITGLDGIRTLAVIGVIVYHLFPQYLPGGYLGVTIFFVVSGYLITDLLNQEWIEHGRINIGAFFKRRFQRLYPALIILLGSSATYIVFFQRDLLTNLREIIISSLLYVNNWWQISNGLSYFDKFATPSPFTHIWSLAVEAQFYLVWPLICWLFYRMKRSATRASIITFGMAILSAIWMAVLFVPGTDPTRVYYGTDTRVFSILIGGWMAFVWPSRFLADKATPLKRFALNYLGLLSLAYLIYVFVTFKFDDPFLYRGGMVVVSLASAFLVASVVHPAGDMNRILTNPIFSWVGTRSYGIYLYQLPVMIFFDAKVSNVNDHAVLNAVIEIVIILIISELSYRMFEHPLRRFKWVDVKAFARDFFTFKSLKFKRTSFILGLFLIGMMGYAMTLENPNAKKEPSDLEKHLADVKKHKKDAKKASSNEEPEYDIYGNLIVKEEPEKEGSLTPEQKQFTQSLPLTTIGDSMALDAQPTLEETFPQMKVDADVGRQLYATTPIIRSMLQTQGINQNVLMILGTNGSFTEDQFDEMMALLGNRHVYWVNVRVPTGRWQDDVNKMLEKMTKRYSNLTVIDWYSASEGKTDWFYDDHVHPNEEGQVHYANVITDAILKKNGLK